MASNDRVDFADLKLFLAVVRRRSFRLAAIDAGQTPSAISHAMRRLEDRLGTKLLNRTSRSVSPTAAGLDLAARLEEGFNQIGAALASFEAPGTARLGSVRLNVFADAAHLLVAPALPEFASRYPDVQLTVVVDDRPIDIIAEGYDAGIRYGHHVPEDMIAVPLTGAQRWVMAASPAYLDRHAIPRDIRDLDSHTCLQLLLGDNSSYRWEVNVQGETARLRVPGAITINDTATTISACKAGMGIAYLLEARILEELRRQELRVVLEEHAQSEDPFHIYYSSRRYTHPALLGLINIIRRQQSLPEILRTHA
ncbi:MAG: LysR family transcriptional regulator [Paraburkholderia tropica]